MELYCGLILVFVLLVQDGRSRRNRDASFGGGIGGILPLYYDHSNHTTDRGGRQCQVGSLTGAVASQKVTEAPKGSLRMAGNHSQSVKAQASLTARQTGRAGTKVGLSDRWFRMEGPSLNG